MTRLRAQISPHDGGGWRLSVVTGDAAGDWPRTDVRTPGVPARAQRREALAALGFEVVPDADWEWRETLYPDGENREPELVATTVVRLLDPAVRCAAAHTEDPTACQDQHGVVQVVDGVGGQVTGCVHHTARMLASIDGARAVALPGHEGAAAEARRRAAALPAFAWLPRTGGGRA